MAQATQPVSNLRETAGTKRLHETLNSLPEKVRIEVIGLLQDRVADSIDLAYQVKHAHWNVRGPNFRSLHKLFDGVYETVQGHIDLLAERQVQLGGFVEGTIQSAAQKTQLEGIPLRPVNELEYVRLVAKGLAFFGEQIRECIKKTDELEDAITNDIFVEVGREIDEKLWMVEAHLAK